MILWRRPEAPSDVDLGELNDGRRGWFRGAGCYVYRMGGCPPTGRPTGCCA